MKKNILYCLLVSLVLTMAACGAENEGQQPDITLIRSDIQNYVNEILDETATVSSFEIVGIEQMGDLLSVNCNAIYNGSTEAIEAAFTLTYSGDATAWTLEKCRVEIEDASAPRSKAEPITIVTQPTDTVVNMGEMVTLSVEALGTDLSYDWWLRDPQDTDKGYPSILHDSTYQVKMNQKRVARSAYCIITDAYGNSVITQTAVMHTPESVVPNDHSAIRITRQPENAVVELGEQITLTVEANGAELRYEWWTLDVGSNRFYRDINQTSNTYTTTMDEACNGRQVFCVILDANGNHINSALATLRAAGHGHYSLSPAATIADEGRTLEISADALMRKDGSATQLLNYRGEPAASISFDSVEYLGLDLYAVRTNTGEPNSTGLLSAEGEMLIPCEAAFLSWPNGATAEDSRYLLVVYTNGMTGQKSKSFVYRQNDVYGWGAKEGAVMYTGYARVFDVVNKCFVENVTITMGDRNAMRLCGSNFFETDSSGSKTLYNEKGEVLFQTGNAVEIARSVYVVRDGDTNRVYDGSGTQTYASNKAIHIVPGTGGYISMSSEGKTNLFDRYGEPVTDISFDNVIEEIDQVFTVQNGEKYGLVHADGTVLFPCATLDRIKYIGYGLYYGYVSQDDTLLYTLLGTDGILAEGLSYSGIENLSVMDGRNALVIKDRAFSMRLEDEYPKSLQPGLIKAQSGSSGLYGLMDLFSGEQLLPYEYEVIHAAAGYLYAFKNGAWEVYQISSPEQ